MGWSETSSSELSGGEQGFFHCLVAGWTTSCVSTYEGKCTKGMMTNEQWQARLERTA